MGTVDVGFAVTHSPQRVPRFNPLAGVSKDAFLLDAFVRGASGLATLNIGVSGDAIR